VKNAAVFANGTRDAVIIEERGRIKLASMNQPITGRVLGVPRGDVAIFMFEERLPPPYSMQVLILDVDDGLEPLMMEICRRWPVAHHEEYDAHLGGQYWRRGRRGMR